MVKIRHFVVDVDEFLVLGNDSVLGEGIVINSSVCSHFSEKNIYHEIASSNIYRLEALAGFFRFLVKGIFLSLSMYCDLLTKS